MGGIRDQWVEVQIDRPHPGSAHARRQEERGSVHHQGACTGPGGAPRRRGIPTGQRALTVGSGFGQVNGELDKFNWSLKKTTFPKVTDQGTGTAKIINFSLKIKFDIVADEKRGMRPQLHKPTLVSSRRGRLSMPVVALPRGI